MLELLMPAGNLKKLKIAFHFGADAVYLGGKDFSLRAFADNFSNDEIVEGINYAHSLGKKVYVTANIFAKNSDFESAKDYFIFLEKAGADAVLITDMGLISLAKKVAPSLPIHLSTQANTSNKYSVEFFKSLGVERVVLARELSLVETKEIHEHIPDMQLEAFVHGAMCMSYSGRCLLSAYFSERSANRGACIQPCRWSFTITEQRNHDSKPILVEQDNRATYFMNSKDLRLISHIPELHEAGICSLKVEGRMKSEFYVATVANTYRKAIDEYQSLGFIENVEDYNTELETIAHRAYTDAYFEGDNLATFTYDEAQIPETHEFIAVVESYENGYAVVEMRNRFSMNNILELLSPIQEGSFEVDEIYLEDGTKTDDAKLVQHHYKISIPYAVQEGDILRKKLLFKKQH